MKHLIRVHIFCIAIVTSFWSFSQNVDLPLVDESLIPGELIVMLGIGDQLSKATRTPLAYPGGTPIFASSAKIIAKRQKIYLITYDHQLVPPFQALKILTKALPYSIVQHNHRISIRNEKALPPYSALRSPDDSEYPSQWSLNNTGQDGGLEDADIDAPESWDISTGGGLSALGDTIVLAIIDEGFDLAHEDLNYWKNSREIPENGIDDDLNGYIDDFDGWNAYTNDGAMISRSHGTHVAGIAAAIGDNELGIAGVSWGLPVLPVAGSSLDESTVVASYAYVLDQRNRYNQTNGREGAFIVASNSSFGVDRGNPNDFPIWCAMYDSMGAAGILNVGATGNSESNVEEMGDIPTRCLSDFFIGVNSTNRSDVKAISGFGEVSIDLAAPGDRIISTIPDNKYGLKSGTSMAVPHVSSAIALLYAAACPELIAQYKSDPAGISLLMRQFILDGVDTLATLKGKTVTGGRLNLKNSLDLLQAYCANPPSCISPFSVSVSKITDVSASISWENLDPTPTLFQYKLVNENEWIGVELSENSINLTNLLSCNFYEYRLASLCSEDTSAFSPVRQFQTENCCEPPLNLSVQEITDSTLLLNWEEIFAANQYVLDYKPSETDSWQTIEIEDTSYLLAALSACTDYEFRIATLCDTGLSSYSPISSFSTSGCGFCLDAPYCASRGVNTNDEWIDSIQIGDFVVNSGLNNGYGDNTDLSLNLTAGLSYPILLEPGYSGFTFNEHWQIWIDLNQDGIFQSPEETVFDSERPIAGTILGELLIPPSADSGFTRMRISMRYNGAPAPCGEIDAGEVEDYCVTIVQDSTLCLPPSEIMVSDIRETTIDYQWDPYNNAERYQVSYQPLTGQNERSSESITIETDVPSISLTDLFPCTNYEVAIRSICQSDSLSSARIDTIRTLGCGTCQDSMYCTAAGNKVDDEWIDKIRIRDLLYTSGPNGGYRDFTNDPIDVQIGEQIAIDLIPGFRTTKFEEYWRIYVDWNQDGNFSEIEELAFDPGFSSNDSVSLVLTVPENTPDGITRMRIVMQYRNAPTACSIFDTGEVEDYCLNIQGVVSNTPILTQGPSRIYPNPTQDKLTIESSSPIEQIIFTNIMGQEITSYKGNLASTMSININSLSKGIYFAFVQTSAGSWSEKIVKR